MKILKRGSFRYSKNFIKDTKNDALYSVLKQTGKDWAFRKKIILTDSNHLEQETLGTKQVFRIGEDVKKGQTLMMFEKKFYLDEFFNDQFLKL